MKHLLNNLTEQEKNSIREQHTGGMNVVTENFSKLINAKSGNVKPLVNEQSGMANAIGSVVKSTQNVYKKYPQYHDKDGNMIGELGKMYNYVMDVWIKEDGGSGFGLEPDSTQDTHSITNGGRKVVWDFKQNKIFFEKDLKFDPTSLTLNSTNFNAFKSWFDKNNQQSDVSDLGWMAKSLVKQGLGLK